MKKVLILGAGFGGIEVTRLLQNQKEYEITVISNKTYFEYYPGLYHIAHGEKLFFSYVPLSYIFSRSVNFQQKTISKIDSQKQKVYTFDNTEFEYDILVIALGSESNYFNTPGVSDDTVLGVRSYACAESLKTKIHEIVDGARKDDTKIHNLAVIGAGPTGVELASDLARYESERSLMYGYARDFFKVHIIDAAPRVLKVFPEEASKRVHKRLESLGIQIHLNEKVIEKKDGELVLGSGILPIDTCIWSGGTKVVSVIDNIDGLIYTTPQKKIEIDEYMRAQGNENIFVIGDNAATKYSGLAQTAISDGYYVGVYLKNKLKNIETKPYVQKQNAYVVPVGSPWGVLVLKDRVYTGLIPFLGRYVIDTLYFMRILSLWKFIFLPFKNFSPTNK